MNDLDKLLAEMERIRNEYKQRRLTRLAMRMKRREWLAQPTTKACTHEGRTS